MSGWFATKRGISSHPLFKGRGDRLAIWVWLLDNAAWKDTQQDVRGKTVIVPRGCVLTSERRIGEELGFGYQVVRTFLTRLTTEGMIKADTNAGRTLICLVNWDTYQRASLRANAAENATLTQDQRTKETRVQEKTLEPNGSKGGEAAEPEALNVVDFAKAVFDLGVRILTASGLKDREARAIVGKWRMEVGDAETFNALKDAAREGVTDPVAWITARLKPKPDESQALKAIFDQVAREVMQ